MQPDGHSQGIEQRKGTRQMREQSQTSDAEDRSSQLGSEVRHQSRSLFFASGLRLLILLISCLGAVVLLNRTSAAESSLPSVRIGFASNMFTQVNENDAKAAIKAWGKVVAKSCNLPAEIATVVFKNDDELLRSLQEKEVDAVGIVMTDFSRLRRKVHFAPIFLTYNGGTFTEQYILLAHQDGSIKSVSDLRGRSLHVHTNPRSNLAPLWLDTLLAQQGHPKASSFAGQISQNTKLSNVVYPVFFRKADACVVTRSGFNTMVELNPQLGRKLTIIAESPHIVPTLFTFRADYNPPFKEKLITGISDLKNSPAGQQVLTIFQSQDIKVHPVGTLNTALKMIETHEQLTRRKK
jgi:ABC-type phosphate/phosphonate transport system substrate-binding protein